MKKLLSLVLVFAMLASMIVINVSAAEVSVWDGSASEYLKGSGTKDDPYLIQSAADLKYFANCSNAGDTFKGKYIVQTVDIDLNNITWTPIAAKDNNAFCGVYDGQGHTISNMLIDQNLASGLSFGLFGYVGKAGSADPKGDCGIANITITGAITVGNARVGGLAGQINHDAYVNNNHRVYIINVTSDVDVIIDGYGSDAIWGGVAGYAASAVFENVTNNGTLKLTGATSCYIPLGGMSGRAENVDMIGCVNNGDISLATTKVNNSIRVGGIVGQIYKKNVNQVQNFINCVNNGKITGSLLTEAGAGELRVHVGGIVGGSYYNVGGSNAADTWTNGTTKWSDFKTTFAGCVNTGAVAANKTKSDNFVHAGGILGSGYANQAKGNNNGGWAFESCVNTGTITATNDGRTGGITQGFWTDGADHYNNSMKNCVVSTTSKKHAPTNNLTNTSGRFVNNVTNDVAATAYINMYSKIVPSTIDINGFDTGVDVSVWTGGGSGMLLGSGTKDDPYLVRNANDLKGLSNLVNGTGIPYSYTYYDEAQGKDVTVNKNGYEGNLVKTFDGKYIKQTADIDLNNIEWLPIGFRETAVFQGVYDGDGHTVSGLKITTISYRTGLFGAVGYVKSHQASQTNVAPTGESGIANLNVSGAVNVESTTGHGDRFYVGGVVSFLGDYSLTDCEYKAYLTNVTSAVNVTAKGFGSGAAFGGVAGHAYNAVLENVISTGSVSVNVNVHCLNPVGGIVGTAASCELISCTNSGAVTLTTDKTNDNTRVGGLVGLYRKRIAADYLTFENCVNNATVSLYSTGANGNRLHAGGILGSVWFGMDYVTNPDFDSAIHETYGKTYAKYDLSIYNCVNTAKGVITVENKNGTGEINAAGIVGTLNHGYNSADNNAGAIKIYDCVNLANVIATPKSGATNARAAGIAGALYTRGGYTFGTEIFNCLTKSGLTGGSTLVNFVENGLTIPRAEITKNSVAGSADADDLAKWNLSLVAPSTININNMPTATKVAVLTGVKNEVVDLPYAVPATMVVVDANGDKVTNITAAGKYTVKLALLGVTPYVTAEYALKYTIAYERDFLTDDADLLVANYGAVIRHFAENFNNFSTYGKSEAAVASMTYRGILPQDMNKVFTMYISDGGEKLITFDYSLATYSFNQLDKTAEELGLTFEQKDALDYFLVDKLKYAAIVQGMKGQTEDLATENLTEEQLALGGTFSAVGLENVKGVTNNVDDDVVTWTAATLVFTDNITIRLKYTTEADLEGYTWKVFVAGEEYANFKVDTDKGYINVAGFAPTMYADVVTAYLVDANGDQVSETVSYSVNSYIVNKQNDAQDGELVKALACYAASAQKYLTSIGK